MRKSVRRLWIPCIMLITGIAMTTFAIYPVRDIFANLDVFDLPYEITDLKDSNLDLNHDIQELRLNIGIAETIDITFTDTPNIKFEGSVVGIDSLKIKENNTRVIIESSCNQLITCTNEHRIASVNVQLPTTFNGKIKVSGISSQVSIAGNDAIQVIDDIDISSVNTTVKLTNVSADTNVDGADITVFGTNIAGDLDLSGLNMTATLSDMHAPMEISVDGMDARLTFNNFDPKLGYAVKMNGLNSVFKDKRNDTQQEASFGAINVENKTNDGNFIIKMDGLSQSFTIEN